MSIDAFERVRMGSFFFFFQAEDGIRDLTVTGVQTCALPIYLRPARRGLPRHGEWWDVPAQPGSRRRGSAGLRGASREPQADAGRAVPAGGCRGARCRDGARAARSRGARPRPAGAGAGPGGASRGEPRTSGTGGKGDAGCGMGSLVCERGSRRRGRARRRRAQAPRRRGGAMTGSGVAAVATVGTFDGIHRGHQAVLREVVRRTEQAGRRTSLLVTFDPHPLEVVNPSAAPRLLTLSDEKRVLAAAPGIEPGGGVGVTPERGRTIGVPTINLTSPDPRKLLPPDGVYAVRVEIDGKRYAGMMNQGPRPTFGVHARGLEIHLFDFTGDVYGASVTVAWARRLRDTQTFPSRQALVDQIERDAIAARAVLKG